MENYLRPPEHRNLKRNRLGREEDLDGVLKSGETVRDSLERRLRAHISISSNHCWEWTGCVTPNGYPQIAFKRKPHYAHRLSFALFIGPIPEGHLVCHKCDNRCCVNPSHLFTGSAKDNAEDASQKGRIPHGEQQYKAKLTDSDVVFSRSAYWNSKSVTQQHLADKFGVSRGTIGKMLRGEKWKHVPL